MRTQLPNAAGRPLPNGVGDSFAGNHIWGDGQSITNQFGDWLVNIQFTYPTIILMRALWDDDAGLENVEFEFIGGCGRITWSRLVTLGVNSTNVSLPAVAGGTILASNTPLMSLKARGRRLIAGSRRLIVFAGLPDLRSY